MSAPEVDRLVSGQREAQSPTWFDKALDRFKFSPQMQARIHGAARLVGTYGPLLSILAGTGLRYAGTAAAHGEDYDQLSLLAKSISPEPELEPHDSENNLLIATGWLCQYLIGGGGELIKWTREKIKTENEARELLRKGIEDRKRRGELPNPYNKVALMLDFTSTSKSRSHESQLAIEIFALLEENPGVKQEFSKKFGEMCEMVRHSVPVPITVPNRIYFRSPTEDFDIGDETGVGQGWLSQTVQAQKATLAIVNLMDPDLDVNDPDRETIKRLNENRAMAQNTVAKIENASEIRKVGGTSMKIAVVNDEVKVPMHGVTTTRVSLEPVTTDLGDDFYYQDYGVVVTEKENMDRMIRHFMDNNLHDIVLFYDGTEEGYAIAENWFGYYYAYREKYAERNGLKKEQLPNLKKVPSGTLPDLINTLNKEPHDAVLLTGANDRIIANSARSIHEFQQVPKDQTTSTYPRKPIICLFRSRTAETYIKDLKSAKIDHPTKEGDKIAHIQDFYIHRHDAKAVLEKALRRKIDWADEPKEKVQER